MDARPKLIIRTQIGLNLERDIQRVYPLAEIRYAWAPADLQGSMDWRIPGYYHRETSDHAWHLIGLGQPAARRWVNDRVPEVLDRRQRAREFFERLGAKLLEGAIAMVITEAERCTRSGGWNNG